MIVLCRNRLWEIDMPWRLYQSLQEKSPETLVDVVELTQSSYKEEKKVPIRDTEEWAIARNKMALGLN